jgi:xanthine dehydrogenase accessory factor
MGQGLIGCPTEKTNLMRELLNDLTTALEARRDLVYCSLVETRGSTPQKAGAAMLVLADGSQRGTLGGGCVEAEVKQRALRVLYTGGKTAVFTFNLDDNYGWDDGLICGGRMSILAEPLPKGDGVHPSAPYYRRLRELAEAGQGFTEAVVLDGGARFLFDEGGWVVAQIAGGSVPEAVTANLTPLSQRPAPGVKQGVAYLPTLPRITLLIVGGGHVGQAVARLASEVDFDVWAVDDRELYASPERFPTARRLLVGDIGVSLKDLIARGEIGPSVYALIVTRGHSHDEEALYHLAPTSAGYVGMIGSKRKIRLIFEDLIARDLPAETLERVHAPLGFHIGSQTVPEIAISIVAELIARRNLGTTAIPPRVVIRPGTTHA